MIDPGPAGRVALVTGANHGIGAAAADVVTFLASDQGRHVTAELIRMS